jgi:histidyl-tRNA synthetase
MELAKGVRDFPPEIQLIRESLFSKIRKSFERHGFSPFASPVLERLDTLTFKFQGDEDVAKEIFRVQDQGGRELGLRFDLTVPLCRFISQNKDLKLPFKRYEIGRAYRDGPIKLGRYREFWQCDADIVGSSRMLADAECIKVASDVLSSLPFDFEIRVNNRKLLNEIMAHLGIGDAHRAIIVLDKLAKQGEAKVREELLAFCSEEQVNSLFDLVMAEGTDNGKLKHLEERLGASEGIQELRELFGFVQELVHVRFDPSLARGLHYYTGTVYEAFLKDNPITGSVAAGGRYDDLIGQMIGSEDKVPAVGISFGIDPLTDALLSEKQRFDRTSTQLFVAPIKTDREASQIADRLRARGIRTDLDVMGRSISKNLDYADKLGIRFVIVVGPKDLAEHQVTLKNMKTGEEHKLQLSELDSVDLSSFD